MKRQQVQRFVTVLLRWHKSNARSFPWRQTQDPYSILVAELFLQRTRAEQVVPVYERFISQFPTGRRVPTLRRLRAIIKSLGLPSRAKRIYRILCRLRNDYNGDVPADRLALETVLGGAHNYVRDAVLLYAFNYPSAPVDRTVARVIARIFLGANPKASKPHTDRTIVTLAKHLVPTENARSYNLALLDFAALICTPKPKCNICPMTSFCKYFIRETLIQSE